MVIQDHQQRYRELRKAYPVFSYKGFHVLQNQNNTEVAFEFEAGDHYAFNPRLYFDFGKTRNLLFQQPGIERLLVFHLGMIEMLSYWKAFCSPRIRIEPYLLSVEQQTWWKKLFRYGLGEFFYTNGIPMPGPEMVDFEFPDACGPLPDKDVSPVTGDAGTVLVPVGGGKDSVVSLEVLKCSGYKIVPFVVNPRGATSEVLETAGFSPPEVITLNRKMDPLLLELNKQGFLNGHTPFSAMLAFVSFFAAKNAAIKHIALSNESSASEPSIPGTRINHQYSKSLEFERDFRSYVADHVDSRHSYFSLLRPLNELQIAALFSRQKKYHSRFRSCNVGSKQNTWCGKCAKCLFTYVVLSPFLSPGALMNIFGRDLFSDTALKETLNDLCGLSDAKPFECVGTIDEVNIALAHTVKNRLNNHMGLPPLLSYYKDSERYPEYQDRPLAEYIRNFDADHCLAPGFEKLVKSVLMDPGGIANGWSGEPQQRYP